MNPFEAVGVLFGVVSVYLITRQNIWGWPTGIVNAALFSVVFYEAKLYADMVLQLFYIGLCVYGWHEWRHGGAASGPLQVSRAPLTTIGGVGLLGAAFTAGLGFMLARYTDASMPWLDAPTASFSLVAQWMQTRKWIENWLVWLVVDVAYLGMYVSQALYLTAGLYLAFLGLAVMGFLAWRRSLVEAEGTRSSSS